MRVMITVLDNTTETSMPFNEFVLYRANHYHDEKQILVLCDSRVALPKVKIPENLEIICVGRKLQTINKSIKQIIGYCKKNNIPYVIHMHQVQSAFLAEMAMFGTGFRKKVLFTVHSTFSGYKYYNKFLSFMNTLLAEHSTCVSHTSFQQYPKLIKWIKGKRIQVVQNGVDVERIDSTLVQRKLLAKKAISFIYVARIIPLKNHEFLVDVLKKCNSRVQFVFVGVEDAAKSIRKKAEDNGLIDRIRFTGLITRNEVFQELQNADFYISSSTLEGLPVSVLEAMYCGLPCILSDIPQHREIAGNEATLLPFDVNVWAKEINRMSNYSSIERKKLSVRLKTYIEKNFALQKMHEQYDTIYKML